MNIKEYKKGVKTKITKNFYSNEFDCHCFDPECKKTYVDVDHVKKLQRLRSTWGSVRINSAYRCEKHNKAVGGSTNSQHKLGTATDIVLLTRTPDQVFEKFNKTWKGGLGAYNTFTHIDSRDGRARWDLRKKT